LIIGLGHVARAGKDTLAARLVERHGFVRVAFADAMRELVYRSDAHTRHIVQLYGWEEAKQRPTVRQKLVDVGNDAREVIGPDVWIWAAFEKMAPAGDYVITDVRYPNEVAAVQSRGVAVKVNRPGVAPLDNVADLALADFDGWDVQIENDGTVALLHARADDLVARLKAAAHA